MRALQRGHDVAAFSSLRSCTSSVIHISDSPWRASAASLPSSLVPVKEKPARLELCLEEAMSQKVGETSKQVLLFPWPSSLSKPQGGQQMPFRLKLPPVQSKPSGQC